MLLQKATPGHHSNPGGIGALLQQVNYVVWAGLSLAIFLSLLFVSSLVAKNEIKNISVQQAYDELALALNDAGILPGVGEGEMLSAFAGQTLDKSKLLAPSPGSSLTTELKLGTVLTAKFQDSEAIFIGIRPEDYKQLVPGKLRQALRKIKHLSYSTQIRQIAGATTQSFTVFVNPNGTYYTVSPGFNGQQCTYVVVI